MKIERISFATRQDRLQYAARRYARFLEGSLLDVGCDTGALGELAPARTYTGIDLTEGADVHVDLEEVDRLPFGDHSFECVACIDVLEHLENLHRIFDELIRVSRRYVLVSLPNNWANARRPIERGKGSIGHYGLPAHPPGDRHRWFFGFQEGLHFLWARERELPFHIQEMHAVEKPRPLVIRLLRRVRYIPHMRYLNRYANSLWALLRMES